MAVLMYTSIIKNVNFKNFGLTHQLDDINSIENSDNCIPLIIITGAPCSGKTTTINFMKQNYSINVLPEAATETFKESDLPSNEFFTQDTIYEIIGDRQIEHYNNLNHDDNTKHITICDRSIVDGYGYMLKNNPEMEYPYASYIQSNKSMFSKYVFFMRSNSDLYSLDGVRFETYEEALEIDENLRKAYIEHGFEIIDVEWNTVENRAKFIMDKICEI